ncbi:MAG: hypothetical protein K2X82_30925 [Gemmataceae bacterium]|nr:hypothetical protein [Gemmataceae bacterium]
MTAHAPDQARPTAEADQPLADLKPPPRPTPKTRFRKKPPAPEPATIAPTLPALDGLDPAKVHALLQLLPPYNTPPPPAPRPGCVTFWDPGLSVNSFRLKVPALFCHADWAVKLHFAQLPIGEGWRQLRLIPAGKEYDRQIEALARDEEAAQARVVVTYLALAFLSTGTRPDLPRVRCRDVLPAGRRVVVGCFPGFGIELANVGDAWTTPGLAVVAVPPAPVRLPAAAAKLSRIPGGFS